jgi:hypothetical protein
MLLENGGGQADEWKGQICDSKVNRWMKEITHMNKSFLSEGYNCPTESKIKLTESSIFLRGEHPLDAALQYGGR